MLRLATIMNTCSSKVFHHVLRFSESAAASPVASGGTGVSTAASRLFGTWSFLSTSYAIESRWYSMGNSAFSCVSRPFKASSRSLGYSARARASLVRSCPGRAHDCAWILSCWSLSRRDYSHIGPRSLFHAWTALCLLSDAVISLEDYLERFPRCD